MARSVKLESSQLNVNDINITVDDTHVIDKNFTVMPDINTTKMVNIVLNIMLSKNARLTIDNNSAINSESSHYIIKNGIFNNAGTLSSNNNSDYQIINGEFYNTDSINNTEILAITGINANIDN